MRIHALIFGGGAAGLWLLDELTRRGISALLLEAAELGGGQTIGSQGILHGGLKYTLNGLLTSSAAEIRDLPALWREHLAGRRPPELIGTPLRSEFCYLWQTRRLSSRLGMIGARVGLRITPRKLNRAERPAVLKNCPGVVARLEEPVISPAGLIANLAARNRERILRVNPAREVTVQLRGPGVVESVVLKGDEKTAPLTLSPQHVVLTAGAGNAGLRLRFGLTSPAMQKRPLHMVLVRGRLPLLNGHCVDGRTTRLTITSEVDAGGRVVYQLGGQLAERGVSMSQEALVQLAISELQAVLPGIDLSGTEWTTYRIDRAEAITPGNKRPTTFSVLPEGNVLTAWPTKLVLVPRLAVALADQIAADLRTACFDVTALENRPRPSVASPPWETITGWTPLGAKAGSAAA